MPVCLNVCIYSDGGVPVAKLKLKRKSYFVDERTVRRAQKALRVKTEAEAIRAAVEQVAEMEEFWEFMNKSKGSVIPGSFERV
jgi:hypothetical protein